MIIINGHPHTLGEALYIARKRAGLTQARLGEKVGCYHSQISEWETGQQMISTQRFVDVIEACAWTIEVAPAFSALPTERGCGKVRA